MYVYLFLVTLLKKMKLMIQQRLKDGEFYHWLFLRERYIDFVWSIISLFHSVLVRLITLGHPRRRQKPLPVTAWRLSEYKILLMDACQVTTIISRSLSNIRSQHFISIYEWILHKLSGAGLISRKIKRVLMCADDGNQQANELLANDVHGGDRKCIDSQSIKKNIKIIFLMQSR